MGQDNVVIVKTWKEHQQDEKFDMFFNALIYLIIPLGIIMFFVFSSELFSFDTSMAISLALYFLLFLVFLFRKKIFKKGKYPFTKRGTPKRHSNGFVKEYLVWFIAFTIGIITSYNLFNSIKINTFLVIIFSGLIIECCSKIMQIFVFKHKWEINKYFLFWVEVQIIVFLISFTIVKNIPSEIFFSIIQSNNFLIYTKYALTGIVQMVLVRLVWKSNIETKI